MMLRCGPRRYECHEGHADAVAGLLDLGADVNVRSPKNGALPIHLACRQGHRDVARLLVQRGAAIDEAMNGGYTALYIACQQGDLEIVSFLLDNGADIEKPKVEIEVRIHFSFLKVRIILKV